MADPFGNLSPEEYQQQQQINRQQKMAEMLMQQNQQPQGQMVSGRYVAPSFFQNIQPIANMLTGAYLAKQGDTKAANLAEAIRTRDDEAMKNLINVSKGTPGQQGGIFGPNGQMTQATTADMYDANLKLNPQYTEKATIEAKPASQEDMLLAAMKLRDPSVKNMMLAERFKPKAPITVAQGAAVVTQNPDGTFTKSFENPKEITHPVSYQEYLLAQKDPIKPFKGSYNEYQDYEANRRRPITNVTTNVMPEQKTFENTQKLRQNFAQEPIYKGFQEVKSAYSQINDGLNLKSPAGDLAAATKFMKILDPGSVVRESELAMAMKATGALDRLQNYAQNVVKGTKLTPTQREDFRKLSTDFYNSSATQYNSKQNEYVEIAKRYNLNPQDVTSAPIKLENTSNTQYAVNPKTNERIMSNDGGKTWSKAP